MWGARQLQGHRADMVVRRYCAVQPDCQLQALGSMLLRALAGMLLLSVLVEMSPQLDGHLAPAAEGWSHGLKLVVGSVASVQTSFWR